MKKLQFLSLLGALAASSILMPGCVNDKCEMTFSYMRYSPVYMSPDEFRSSVQVTGVQDLKNPGKIFAIGSYLYVNEVAKGIHIIDNRDSRNPVKVGFIKIPGNYDLAIKDNLLYADASVDLLIFNISNPTQPMLENRVINAFPHMLNYRGYVADGNKGIVVDWVEEKVVEKLPNCDGNIPDLWQSNAVTPQMEAAATSNGFRTQVAAPAGSGKAGSMARFAIKDNHFYVVLPKTLEVYSIAGSNVSKVTSISIADGLSREAQTIFPYNDMLFIGANNGMMIYNAANPESPTSISEISHTSSCDPVVVEGKYAYVTLNNAVENPCEGYSNQLEVVDIGNPSSPFVTKIYQMTEPKGLGIDNSTLFVTDGKDGLHIFDAKYPESLTSHQIAKFGDMRGYDVIPFNNLLFFVGQDGIAEYDYSDPQNIKFLSKIPAVK